MKTMKVIIVEDEKAAVRNLRAILEDVAPECEIETVIDSVTDAIEWIDNNPLPDLIFMDIHLADGSAFEIFENRDIECPVIFTTAYDEYAIKAFKVNSIDYLLKPISGDMLRSALDKYEKTSAKNNLTIKDLCCIFESKRSIATHFLVPVRVDNLNPLSATAIRYFLIDESIVKAVNEQGEHFAMNNTLDELSQMIDPQRFFRANRQFIITRESIEDIDLWFNNRLSVNLKGNNRYKVIISRQRVSEFKTWFSNIVN